MCLSLLGSRSRVLLMRLKGDKAFEMSMETGGFEQRDMLHTGLTRKPTPNLKIRR